MTQPIPPSIDGAGLPALEARVQEDLTFLCVPGKAWVPARTHNDETVHDVIIIGAGMCGMAAWLALRTGGITNVRVLDRSPAGFEGRG